MKEQTTKIICDNCNRETKMSKPHGTFSEYPYDKGWVYLYEINFKTTNKIKKAKDLHFCCKICMVNKISKMIFGVKKNLPSISTTRPKPSKTFPQPLTYPDNPWSTVPRPIRHPRPREYFCQPYRGYHKGGHFCSW